MTYLFSSYDGDVSIRVQNKTTIQSVLNYLLDHNKVRTNMASSDTDMLVMTRLSAKNLMKLTVKLFK